MDGTAVRREGLFDDWPLPVDPVDPRGTGKLPEDWFVSEAEKAMFPPGWWRETEPSEQERAEASWAARTAAVEPLRPQRLTGEQVAAELQLVDAARARHTAYEAELICRLASLRPESWDPPRGEPGARARTRRESEFSGVSEFFPAEVAHILNVGRGTAVLRVARAFTWRDKLPRTFTALKAGTLDERRANKFADLCRWLPADICTRLEDALLGELASLSLMGLEKRVAALCLEWDPDAGGKEQQSAAERADVFCQPTGAPGRVTFGADMSVEEGAAAYALIDALAAMAKSDGDTRPVNRIRSEIHSLLLRLPGLLTAGNDLGVRAQVTITATLESLEGGSSAPGEVAGFVITVAQLRELLRRVGALGLRTPDGGSLEYAVTDRDGRLLTVLTPTELAKAAAATCPEHGESDSEGGGGGCDCPAAGMPADTTAYRPTAKQQRFVRTRDRRCRMPTCGQLVGWADLDHVIPHSCDGPTSCNNLCCLCRSDHRLKTFAHGWLFAMDPDGTLHVTSPSGVTRTTRPPGLGPSAAGPPEPAPPPEDPPPPAELFPGGPPPAGPPPDERAPLPPPLRREESLRMFADHPDPEAALAEYEAALAADPPPF